MFYFRRISNSFAFVRMRLMNKEVKFYRGHRECAGFTTLISRVSVFVLPALLL